MESKTTSLESSETLAKSKKEEEKKEEAKEGNATNSTVDPKVKRKAVVTNVWKMGAEGFGHASDPLPVCTEEEIKAQEEEKKAKEEAVEELKKEGKYVEPETPLIKKKPKCKKADPEAAAAEGAAAEGAAAEEGPPAAPVPALMQKGNEVPKVLAQKKDDDEGLKVEKVNK